LSSAKKLALLALEASFTKNARQPVLLHVTELSSYTDYLLVLSARSTRQVAAITNAIRKHLKDSGYDPLGVEGERGTPWMLMDYGDVVIHVFHHPQREFYDLESLWSEAPRVALEVPPELRWADQAQDDDDLWEG